uniref:Uncharacterized protein n=1 Tax=Pinctada fucata TaxID=50426 RepID=A0A194AMP1_PINFU
MTKLYFLVVVGLLCLVVANAWPQYRRGEQQPGSRTGEENGKEEPPSGTGNKSGGKKGKCGDVKDKNDEEDQSNPNTEERVFNLLRELYERGTEDEKNEKLT